MIGKTLRRKFRSDRGSSAMISFVLLVPMFLGLVITAVDVGFFFSNRGQVDTIASASAGTAAIFGGDGTRDRATTIEKSYGISRTVACSSARANDAPNKKIWTSVNKSNYSAVECNALYAMAMNTGFVSVSMGPGDGVDCGPSAASAVGSRIYCTVTYSYDGMPGAPLSFIQIRRSDESSGGLLSRNVITKSSESEVMNPPLVDR